MAAEARSSTTITDVAEPYGDIVRLARAGIIRAACSTRCEGEEERNRLVCRMGGVALTRGTPQRPRGRLVTDGGAPLPPSRPLQKEHTHASHAVESSPRAAVVVIGAVPPV